MDIKALFEQAVANSKTLAEKPSNTILLQLYSLYKRRRCKHRPSV